MAYREAGYKPQKHWSDRIKGRGCNGCICMEVLPRHRKWYEYEEYYCSWRHEVVKPDEMPELGKCGHRRDA